MVRSRLMCSVFAVLAATAAAAWLMPMVPSATAEPSASMQKRPMMQLASVHAEQGSAPRGTISTPNDMSALPTVTGVTITADRPTVIEGTARASRAITVTVSGRVVGQVRTGADGIWQLTVAQGLGAGDHRIIAVAASRDGARQELSDVVRIAIPYEFTGTMGWGTPRDLAGAALADAVASHTADLLPRPALRLSQAGQVIRVAQAQNTPATTPAQAPADDSVLGTFLDWLQRSSSGYQEVTKKLSEGDAPVTAKPTPQATAPAVPATPAAPKPPVTATAPSATPPTVTVPVPTTPAATPPAPKPAVPTVVAQVPATTPAQTPAAEPSIAEQISEWFARSKRDYEEQVMPKLTDPPTSSAPVLTEAQKLQIEAKRQLELKTTAEAQKKADEERRAAASKTDDAAKKVLEDTAKAAAATKKAADDATATAAAAAKKIADDAASASTAAAKKTADDAAAKKLADDKRVADDAAKRTAE